MYSHIHCVVVCYRLISCIFVLLILNVFVFVILKTYRQLRSLVGSLIFLLIAILTSKHPHMVCIAHIIRLCNTNLYCL